jgi:hypothetical protein
MQKYKASFRLAAVIVFVAAVISAVLLITPDMSDTIPRVDIPKATAGETVQQFLSE